MDHNEESLAFLEGHPGHSFAYLEKNVFLKIPMIAMDKGKLCLLKDLNIGCVDPDEITKENRERYEKKRHSCSPRRFENWPI